MKTTKSADIAKSPKGHHLVIAIVLRPKPGRQGQRMSNRGGGRGR